MKYESEPLGRREGIEHDQQGEADRVGQQRFLLGLRRSLGTDQRIGDVEVERLLASGVPRPQHVQTDATNDRGQPTAHVFDPARVRSTDAQPGVLDGIVSIGQ